MARHRRPVLITWLLVLIACGALYPSLLHSLGAPNYGIDKAESSRAAQLLEQRFAGHGSEHLLGFTSTGFIQVYLPLSIFALLFGLSMDYEVFLIRRMRETWEKTHDNELAVATGVEHTARPISAAAAIMVAVFGSFVSANVLELKQFGLGLALAIAIDATLVRLVLVPALMRLLGARNWWLPQRRRPSAAPRRAGQEE
jgi:RND superfamily putative drug exporter